MNWFLGGIGTSVHIPPEKGKLYSEVQHKLEILGKFEERFEVFVSSLLELEKHSLNSSVEYLFSDWGSQAALISDQSWTNARLLTFLFCGRAVEEQTIRGLNAFSQEAVDAYKSVLAQAFESHFEYQLMYSLRNALTHGDIDVVHVWYANKRQWEVNADLASNSRSRISHSPRLKISELLKMEKLKGGCKKRLHELESRFDFIDLRSFWRVYAEQLARAHFSAREATEGWLRVNKCAIDEAETLFAYERPEERLYTVFSDQTSDLHAQKPFSNAFYEEIVSMRHRWKNLDSHRWRFISNELVRQTGVYLGETGRIWVPE